MADVFAALVGLGVGAAALWFPVLVLTAAAFLLVPKLVRWHRQMVVSEREQANAKRAE